MEAVVALPVLLVVILGIIQFGLVYEAKATLNHAGLQAARAGSVSNADVAAIRLGLARGLLPLFSPDSSIAGAARKLATINAQVATDARVRILNPTREAFDDFGEDVNGARELPNDRLQARSTVLGTRSGMNIQDANLLRVEITYGYELQVPLVNWFLSRVLLTADRAGVVRWDAFEQQLLRRGRLPITATSTVRMQSPARLNDAMMSKADLPDVPRVPANARPTDDHDATDDGADEEHDGTSQAGDEDEGHSLADGAFGFHGDHSEENPEGGGTSPASGGGSGMGSSTSNGGSPAVCAVPSNGGGLHDVFDSPGNGNSSPVEPAPSPFFNKTQSSSAATLPGNSLPSLGVGNPIHVVTGNKYQAETDLQALPGRLGLMFSRHYNSESADYAGIFGAGWRHAFDAHVLVTSATQNKLDLVQADGRRISFEQVSPNLYRGTRSADGELRTSNDGYRWRWNDGRELAFDEAGRLVTIQDHGVVLQLRYMGDRLASVIDPQQRQLSFSYYDNGRVAAVRAPAGFEARYRYDDRGNLVEVLYADGSARQYRYEDARFPHHLTRILAAGPALREFGRHPKELEIAAWTYDDRGRATSSSHPESAGRISIAYANDHTDVTDAFGKTTRYRFEQVDGVARIKSVQGATCGCGPSDVSYEYGPGFALTSIRPAHDPAITYQYDTLGRVTEVGRIDLGGNHEWRKRYRYDSDSRIPSTIEMPSVRPGASQKLQVGFDASGNLNEITQEGYAPTDAGHFTAISRTVRFEYGARGELVTYDGFRTDVPDVTHYTYDSLGRLTRIEPPGGETVRITQYDAAGRMTAFQRGTDAEVHIDYDVLGRVHSVQGGTKESSIVYGYDDFGRLQSTVDGNGRQHFFRYDRANRLSTMASDAGLEEQHRFDADDLPREAVLKTSAGLVLRTLHFAYDSERRLIETRDGSGPPLQQLRYTDPDRRPDSVIDPLGFETGLGYDNIGRLATIHSPDGGDTRFGFDHFGHTQSIKAPNDVLTRYAYDDFGRRVQEISPDRGQVSWRYDVADNLIQKTDARGAVIRYEYDAANRLVRIEEPQRSTTLRYRGPLLEEVSNHDSTEHLRYDDRGRLIEHTRIIDGHDFTTRFERDEKGRVLGKRLPSGERLAYRYNDRGQLVGISTSRFFRSLHLLGQGDKGDAAPPLPNSGLGNLTLGNGLVTRTRLDFESGGIAYRGTDAITRFKYEHDAAGRIVGFDRPGERVKYGYDANGRLTSATSPIEQVTYEYDTNGNRTRSTRTTASGTQQQILRYQPGSNRLISVKDFGADVPVRYSYDAAGNPISAGEWRYEYNAAGRLVKLFHKGTLRAEYRYNAQGERIRKDVFADGKSTRTYFIYEDHQLIAEANEYGRVTREYLYLGHHPVVMLDDGKPYWIHTDQLGAPRAVTDTNGRIIWSATYCPFGKATSQEDPDHDFVETRLDLRLPGQYEDEESGIYYNYTRDYSPVTGRYTTPDPLGSFDGPNPFAYVRANPVSHIDPLGLYDEMIHYYATYFLGIVAGLPQDIARTIALATAYVDENPLTAPKTLTGSVNEPAVFLYHFTMNYQALNRGDGSSDVLSRFQMPHSQQLDRLLASTDEAKLNELWRETHDSDACDDQTQNARYQLYGEYLHAFEDTFAHRDSLNLPYTEGLNLNNTPAANIGHFGMHGPSRWEAPDLSYNQDYRPDESECRIYDVRRGPYTVEGLTEQQCSARGEGNGVLGSDFTAAPTEPAVCELTRYSGVIDRISGITPEQCSAAGDSPGVALATWTPPDADEWRYNELRTLRMEYEIFTSIQNAFTPEIADHRRDPNPPPATTWADLAGHAWNDNSAEANARIGLDQTLDEWRTSQGMDAARTILQTYNAYTGGSAGRVKLLNDWLETNGYKDARGDSLIIEEWSSVAGTGNQARTNNIGWIPAGSFQGVLLPHDADNH